MAGPIRPQAQLQTSHKSAKRVAHWPSANKRPRSLTSRWPAPSGLEDHGAGEFARQPADLLGICRRPAKSIADRSTRYLRAATRRTCQAGHPPTDARRRPRQRLVRQSGQRPLPRNRRRRAPPEMADSPRLHAISEARPLESRLGLSVETDLAAGFFFSSRSDDPFDAGDRLAAGGGFGQQISSLAGDGPTYFDSRTQSAGIGRRRVGRLSALIGDGNPSGDAPPSFLPPQTPVRLANDESESGGRYRPLPSIRARPLSPPTRPTTTCRASSAARFRRTSLTATFGSRSTTPRPPSNSR